jgi:hypothetical protein
LARITVYSAGSERVLESLLVACVIVSDSGSAATHGDPNNEKALHAAGVR